MHLDVVEHDGTAARGKVLKVAPDSSVRVVGVDEAQVDGRRPPLLPLQPCVQVEARDVGHIVSREEGARALADVIARDVDSRTTKGARAPHSRQVRRYEHARPRRPHPNLHIRVNMLDHRV